MLQNTYYGLGTVVGIEYEGLGPKMPPEANDFHPPIHFRPNYIVLENLWHS